MAATRLRHRHQPMSSSRLWKDTLVTFTSGSAGASEEGRGLQRPEGAVASVSPPVRATYSSSTARSAEPSRLVAPLAVVSVDISAASPASAQVSGGFPSDSHLVAASGRPGPAATVEASAGVRHHERQRRGCFVPGRDPCCSSQGPWKSPTTRSRGSTSSDLKDRLVAVGVADATARTGNSARESSNNSESATLYPSAPPG
jgi:hypothetical protein